MVAARRAVPDRAKRNDTCYTREEMVAAANVIIMIIILYSFFICASSGRMHSTILILYTVQGIMCVVCTFRYFSFSPSDDDVSLSRRRRTTVKGKHRYNNIIISLRLCTPVRVYLQCNDNKYFYDAHRRVIYFYYFFFSF